MAPTTVREHRLAAGYALIIPSSLAFGLLLAGRNPAFLAVGFGAALACAGLTRRYVHCGRPQHARLGPRVRRPPAPIHGVPSKAGPITRHTHTHARSPTRSHPAPRRLLDCACTSGPLRAVTCRTAGSADDDVDVTMRILSLGRHQSGSHGTRSNQATARQSVYQSAYQPDRPITHGRVHEWTPSRLMLASLVGRSRANLQVTSSLRCPAARLECRPRGLMPPPPCRAPLPPTTSFKP